MLISVLLAVSHHSSSGYGRNRGFIADYPLAWTRQDIHFMYLRLTPPMTERLCAFRRDSAISSLSSSNGEVTTNGQDKRAIRVVALASIGYLCPSEKRCHHIDEENEENKTAIPLPCWEVAILRAQYNRCSGPCSATTSEPCAAGKQLPTLRSTQRPTLATILRFYWHFRTISGRMRRQTLRPFTRKTVWIKKNR